MVSRLKKEKELRSLVNEDLRPGQSFLEKSMHSAGNKVVPVLIAGTTMYVVRGVLTKEWGLKDLASNIPKLKK